MPHPLERLRRMAYPGRVIALGRDPSDEYDVVVYAITGRSPSSQARLLERAEISIVTKPTDPEILKTGNPDLLVYPAVYFGERPAVSNGKQTRDIARAAAVAPVAALEAGLRNWTYEPDAPIFTPRISGLLWPDGRAALSVIKRADDGAPRKLYFEFALKAGQAELISTYSGPNQNPLPVFQGEPLPLVLAEQSAEATVEAFYEALGPDDANGPDFRVAAACVFVDRNDPSR
ncbi:MAG: IMP cyclohydrolase, partial [Candidatus Aminicenantales bacterium]